MRRLPDLRKRRMRKNSNPFLPVLLSLGLLSCSKDMAIQNRPVVMKEDPSTLDRRSDLPQASGSVEVKVASPPESNRGRMKSIESTTVSPSLSFTLDLAKGRRQFEIYCSLCHDRAGTGLGMITLRGFPKSRSLTDLTDTFRSLSAIEMIIDQGRNSMPAFHGRLTQLDQTNVAAYVLALDFSHRVPEADLDKQDLQQLGKQKGAR